MEDLCLKNFESSNFQMCVADADCVCFESVLSIHLLGDSYESVFFSTSFYSLVLRILFCNHSYDFSFYSLLVLLSLLLLLSRVSGRMQRRYVCTNTPT